MGISKLEKDKEYTVYKKGFPTIVKIREKYRGWIFKEKEVA